MLVDNHITVYHPNKNTLAHETPFVYTQTSPDILLAENVSPPKPDAKVSVDLTDDHGNTVPWLSWWLQVMGMDLDLVTSDTPMFRGFLTIKMVAFPTKQYIANST